MDENSIRKYAGLMKELGLTGLEINENGGVVRLEMNPAVPAAAVNTAAAAVPETKAPENGGDCINVCSPMVGVFYAAPAENAEPYVKTGDRVRRGDVLCIVEAMKLMNEIVAEDDGIISEVCVNNNQIVDYGRVLFKIRKESL